MYILAWNNTSKSAICYCTRGFKFGVCVHKLALEIVHGTMKKVVELVPQKKRRKRKSPKALDKDEPQQQTKKDKRKKSLKK